jgi:hypothetical protein
MMWTAAVVQRVQTERRVTMDTYVVAMMRTMQMKLGMEHLLFVSRERVVTSDSQMVKGAGIMPFAQTLELETELHVRVELDFTERVF